MRYFTKELWAGINDDRKAVCDAAHDQWRKNDRSYSRDLKRVLPKLTRKAAVFFSTPCLMHDGGPVRAEIWDDDSKRCRRSPSRVRLVAVTWFDDHWYSGLGNGPYQYELLYSGVSAIQLSSDASLFPSSGSIFEAWGYDELTRGPKPGTFCHSILFSAGTELTITFERFSWSRKKQKRA